MRTYLQLGLAITLIFCTTIKSSRAQAPGWLWAKAVGGMGSDKSNSVAIDAAGNTYIAGYFSGTADFDPGPMSYTLTSSGYTDIFVCKLDSSGNFIWANAMGGLLYDEALSLTLDASGNILITGYFQGTVDFDPGNGTNFITSTGVQNVFICKLTSAGNFVFAKNIGGPLAGDAGLNIICDPYANGSAYVSGYFTGTSDFDPGSGIHNITAAGLSDIFIAKYDNGGNFIWVKNIGGGNIDYGYTMTLDTVGIDAVYLGGTFQDSCDFDPGSGIAMLTSNGDKDIFIAKFDSAGNFIWAKSMGGIEGDGNYAMSIDSKGNIYSTGYFRETIDFDPGAGIYNLVSIGNDDVYILKLSSSGDFKWVRQLGGTNTDVATAILVDKEFADNIYTTGLFYDTADFDPGINSFNMISAGNDDIFISKIDSSGNFIWAKSAGGLQFDKSYGMALDHAGNLAITGYFLSNSSLFSPYTLVNVDNSGNSPDIFIAKLQNITTGIQTQNASENISIYPNPASSQFMISLPSNNENTKIQIFDLSGKVMKEVNTNEKTVSISTRDFSEGIYLLKIQNRDFVDIRRFMVTK